MSDETEPGIASIEGIDGTVVHGRVPPEISDEVILVADGRPVASATDIFPDCDADGRIRSPRGRFRVCIPAPAEERNTIIELVHQGNTLDCKELTLLPIRHANGIAANDILALHRYPLVAANGIEMKEGRLDMTGLALPPRGDPSRVTVRVDDADTGFQFQYPLPSLAARPTYWYWPNSDFAGFKLSIALADRPPSAAPSYKVEFRFNAPDSAHSGIKNTFHIPKSFGAYENFPDLRTMQRRQVFDSPGGVALRGYSDAVRLLNLARAYGLSYDHELRVLDWGCGHGRVLRHLPSLSARIRGTGIDFDADNVAWAKDHLPGIDFQTSPLMPPTTLPDEAFDLIYGISVMPHLNQSAQTAWLQEIYRILAPGGVALLSFAGDTAVAFASRYLSPGWLADYVACGWRADPASDDRVAKSDDAANGCNVKINARRATELCREYFEVWDVLECMFGYQDLAVLRRS